MASLQQLSLQQRRCSHLGAGASSSPATPALRHLARAAAQPSRARAHAPTSTPVHAPTISRPARVEPLRAVKRNVGPMPFNDVCAELEERSMTTGGVLPKGDTLVLVDNVGSLEQGQKALSLIARHVATKAEQGGEAALQVRRLLTRCVASLDCGVRVGRGGVGWAAAGLARGGGGAGHGMCVLMHRGWEGRMSGEMRAGGGQSHIHACPHAHALHVQATRMRLALHDLHDA